MPQTDDVGVLGVDRGESRQEGGGLADGALALVVGKKLEGFSLCLRHTLEEEEVVPLRCTRHRTNDTERELDH